LFLLLLAGCGAPPADETPAAAVDGAPFPVAFTDTLGRAVRVDRRPGRIVSLAPAVTETLFALGAGPRVVAVTTMDNYPPEVRRLPKVGGFSPETISTEGILAAKPDLVLAGGRFQEPIVRALAKLGVTAAVIDPSTLEAVQEAITQVGLATGQRDEAAALLADFRRRLDAVRRRTAAVPAADRPKVLYVLWDDPLQTAGPGTFVGQMISLAGGVHLLKDSQHAYPRLSDEAVLAWDPDLILAPDHGADGLPDRLRRRPGWGRLKAVRQGRIVTVPQDLVHRPGPRLVAGVAAIEAILRETSPPVPSPRPRVPKTPPVALPPGHPQGVQDRGAPEPR
jgi:iron complex transport system substrate-binding protein